MEMGVRLLVVDDSELVRKGLRRVLQSKPGWEVCEASDGESAVEMFKAQSPDVVIMDLQMPGLNGIETSAKILAIEPAAKIVMFTQHASGALEQHAREMGVRSVVSKTDTFRMLGMIEELVGPTSSDASAR
jgi:two-component system, NarL family, invasion response regulator UvrY